jgi:hypothetical protein
MRATEALAASGCLARFADHLHLLLAERVETREQVVENAAFLLEHRRFQQLGPLLAYRR